MPIDLSGISGKIAKKISEILSGYATNVGSYAKSEGKKLATSLAEIERMYAEGTIDAQEAKLHLSIQRNASRAVLMGIAGVTILTAEQAINAALGIVEDTVNNALGFALL